MSRSRAKKRLAAWVYENRNLDAARLLHATSAAEADSCRRYGLRQSIAVIPNGVELPPVKAGDSREALEARFPDLRGRRWLLFLGRLDPKKQLELLLDLWRELAPGHPGWTLVVAGPDLSGYGARLERRAAENEAIREHVVFTGMLEAREKSSALGGADLFVLPTLSENFGIAVAEALAHGTPVLTTTAAPWSEIRERDCGWWVEPTREALGTALAAALRTERQQLEEMGERGRELVREHYGWDSIGRGWIEVYRWLLDGGSPPDCVRLD